MPYLLSLFSGKPIYYVILAFSILTALTGLYAFAYHKGVVNTENKLATQYAKLLEEKLSTNAAIMKREFDSKLLAEHENKQVQVVYIQRNNNAKDIVKNSKNLSNKDCQLSEEDKKAINALTGRVK